LQKAYIPINTFVCAAALIIKDKQAKFGKEKKARQRKESKEKKARQRKESREKKARQRKEAKQGESFFIFVE
jgi:hypothetical protein